MIILNTEILLISVCAMLLAYCFPFRRSLSAGTASAASLDLLAAGSSARAVPAGVSRLHSNQISEILNKYKGIHFQLFLYHS